MQNRKRIKIVLIGIGLISFMIILGAIWLHNTDAGVAPPTAAQFNMDALTRGRVSSSSLSGRMNRSQKRQVIESLPPTKKMKKEKRKLGKSFGGPSKNSQKDREILMKYASMGGLNRRHVTPNHSAENRYGSGSNGGVFVVGGEKKKRPKKVLHDVKIKVKLKISIRSTSRSPVIAEVVLNGQKVAKGTKFIGTPSSFSNGRTHIRFSQMRFGEKKESIQGFAVSGKDPGIPSDVTDISSNIDKTVHSGAIKSVTAVATGLASGLGSGAATAANNMISPAGNEVASQKESNKMQQEFRVPAGTVFYIYLE